MEQTIILCLFSFVAGYFLAQDREKVKCEKKLAALIRSLKCFYKLKSNKESTDLIILDAIALGVDLNYIVDCKDLFEKWRSWRNYRIQFATKKHPLWKGDSQDAYKLTDYSIYIPQEFKPVNLSLDDYKHLKSYDLGSKRL